MKKKKRLMILLGTRPEIIKLAPIILRIKKEPSFVLSTCFTGQHGEMALKLARQFGIRLDSNLRIMTKKQDLFQISERLLRKLRQPIEKFNPDLVFVQGDTSSALLGALAAFYLKTPVAHIEAGLRSNNPYNPFPEEMNRRLISQIADIHFAPTKINRANLSNEGVLSKKILVCGNTGIDALQFALQNPPQVASQNERLINGLIKKLSKEKKQFAIVTAHRRENHGEAIKNLALSLKKLAYSQPNFHWIFSMHPNPAIKLLIRSILSGLSNVHLLPSIDYFLFCKVLKTSKFIVTDSGGIQEEAGYLRKPVLIYRKNTERVELLKYSNVKLCDSQSPRFDFILKRMISTPDPISKDKKPNHLFGDGSSSKRIIKFLKTEYFK